MSERSIRAEAEWPFSVPLHGVGSADAAAPVWAGARDGHAAAERRANSFVGRHALAIAVGAWTLAIVLVAGASVSARPPSYAPMDRLLDDPDGRVSGVAYVSGELLVRAAPGIDASRSAEMACRLVRPIVAGTPLESTRFRIFTESGVEIASDRTPCA